jgi:hypothetical protein
MRFDLQPFNRNVPDDELLADLKRAFSAVGKPLTFRAYRDAGQYHPSTIIARFGSWNDALQRAGVPLNGEKGIPTDALFDNLKLVWIARGRQPVYREMNAPPSQFTASTYNARFGGWRKALEAFVATVTEDERILGAENEIAPTNDVSPTPRQPSLALRFFVLKRDSFRCVACGRSPATTAALELEVDHVQAWTKGGRTVVENLQTLCFECNRGKCAT